MYEPSIGTMLTAPLELKALGEDRKDMVSPAVAAAKAGGNAAAVRVFMDSVNAQTGTFEALPLGTRTIMLDNARMLPLLFASPPPPSISYAQLGQIKAPVAIVRGELTRPYYRTIADAASRCIPGSKLIIVPNARHLWPGQDPSAFNETVLDFLKSN